jgi:hypothetical protein
MLCCSFWIEVCALLESYVQQVSFGMKGWIDGVGMVNNYLRVFVLQIVYVIKLSDYSTSGTWYLTKVTVSLFKDRPKVGVVFDLNT